MPKVFNVTGLCVPEQNYMVDLTDRVHLIVSEYICKNKYFTINRARQYGKTTLLYCLENELREDYIVVSLSFEAADEYFQSAYALAEGLTLDIADCLRSQGVSGDVMLQEMLFDGSHFPFDQDNHLTQLGVTLGFLKEEEGNVVIQNRIFETRLYDFFLAEEALDSAIYRQASAERNQFVADGVLDMKLVMEKFCEHYTEVYGDSDARFAENEGRKLFLLYLKPIINGTGNYYIEARTRNSKRTDIIVDYLGQQYIIELKIWHGKEYNKKGETQLSDYLEIYGQSTGYMLSFNFNKNKQPGMREIVLDGKRIFEMVV